MFEVPAAVEVAVVVFFGSTGWLTLFVQRRAEDEAKKRFAEMIGGELARFKDDLLKTLNGTYRRAHECDLIEGNAERRLTKLEAKVDEISGYAHHSKHALAGEMQKLIGMMEAHGKT